MKHLFVSTVKKDFLTKKNRPLTIRIFVKNVLAGNEDTMKKNQKLVIKRIVYAVSLFFVFEVKNEPFKNINTTVNADSVGVD